MFNKTEHFIYNDHLEYKMLDLGQSWLDEILVCMGVCDFVIPRVCLTVWACVFGEVILGFLLTAAGCGQIYSVADASEGQSSVLGLCCSIWGAPIYGPGVYNVNR